MRIGLKGKSYLIVFFICLLVFVGSSLLVYELSSRSISKVEKVLMEENLSRADFAVQESSRGLQSLCRDWSWWDDTYYFVQDFNEQYVRSNLTAEILTNLDLDIVMFLTKKINLLSHILSREWNPQSFALLPVNVRETILSAKLETMV